MIMYINIIYIRVSNICRAWGRHSPECYKILVGNNDQYVIYNIYKSMVICELYSDW